MAEHEDKELEAQQEQAREAQLEDKGGVLPEEALSEEQVTEDDRLDDRVE